MTLPSCHKLLNNPSNKLYQLKTYPSVKGVVNEADETKVYFNYLAHRVLHLIFIKHLCFVSTENSQMDTENEV
ncbi:CLUMA_CG007049, isoform A [Clunio marinus]|uniref:CLUMA_CG007049, isoform A n=1 Tax=Clunio marinus TaxID=568069 RepID=A0A1J1I1Q2_9DIPT|nr:CLUMA_CG007049, isoform A [Clunio marinus]